jgi:serine/threonine protein phosphatase PrpC
MNGMLAANPGIDTSLSGSTGVIAFINSKLLVVGSIGDSRAFLYKKASPSDSPNQSQGMNLTSIELTKIHTPYDPQEAERIKLRGGDIRPAATSEGEEIGPLRVWQGKSKFPGLMMTRSFGDKMGHGCGMNCVPCKRYFIQLCTLESSQKETMLLY